MKFIVATVALVVFISAVYADDKPEESTMVSVGDCEISQVLGGEPLYFAGERNSQNKFERIVRFPEGDKKVIIHGVKRVDAYSQPSEFEIIDGGIGESFIVVKVSSAQNGHQAVLQFHGEYVD